MKQTARLRHVVEHLKGNCDAALCTHGKTHRHENVRLGKEELATAAVFMEFVTNDLPTVSHGYTTNASESAHVAHMKYTHKDTNYD